MPAVGLSRFDRATVWDPVRGEPIQQLLGHFGPIWGIDWSHSGDRIATCSRDGTVRVWEPRSGAEAIRLQSDRRSGGYWCVRWSPDDQRIAAGSSVGMIPIWNANRTQVVSSPEGNPITSQSKSLSIVSPVGPKGLIGRRVKPISRESLALLRALLTSDICYASENF